MNQRPSTLSKTQAWPTADRNGKTVAYKRKEEQMKIVSTFLTVGAVLAVIGVSSVFVFSQETQDTFTKYPGNEITRLIDRISIETPYHYKNLTIFPITLSNQTDSRNYLTLDEGFKRNLLIIREVDQGEVNTVLLKNKSNDLIFGMSGEVVVGAKQDRMLKNDILIPPRSGWLKVPVYCVEHGRWVAVSDQFYSKEFAASPGLRQRAAETKDQSEVWNEVARSQAALGVSPATGAFGKIYESKEVQGQSKPYEESFADLPQRSSTTIGVVVAIGDRLVCADIFAHHKLFNKMWKKLLRSYVIDALKRHDQGEITKSEVRDFLDNVYRAEIDEQDTPGRGSLYQVASPMADGSALIYNGSVLHFDLFPKVAPTPIREDDPSAPRLDIRRQQRLGE